MPIKVGLIGDYILGLGFHFGLTLRPKMKSKAQYVIPPTNMTQSSLFLKDLNNIEASHSLFTNVLELMTCHMFISIFNEGFHFGFGISYSEHVELF